MPHTCRFCAAPLDDVVVDLGVSPLCESFLRSDELDRMEPFYPLRAMVCARCFLVQLPAYVAPDEIFVEYAYFSSYSDSWLDHARKYAERMRLELDLGPDDLVVELGSNDGYLLRNFVDAGIPVLGIEPAQNVARTAEAAGVTTLPRFFSLALARELRAAGRQASLIACNNTLAQIPDLNDAVAGMAELLAPTGLLTIEVPHLLRLLEDNQFDTIYHEHFSYFSLATLDRIMTAHGLTVVDVDELSTHGGSLRVHVRHVASAMVRPSVPALIARERQAGLEDLATYGSFGDRVAALKRAVLSQLIAWREAGLTVAGYGAPGKANTLLNYCGVGPDLLAFTVDRNPYKHGRFTPGMRIPIYPPEKIDEVRPDIVWILPWNLEREIATQLAGIAAWGGRLFVAIPGPHLLEPGGVHAVGSSTATAS